MHNQPDLNQDMRAILIDRMVELQLYVNENFELNHETLYLYLAVKITDHYLALSDAGSFKYAVESVVLVIINAERCPPCFDDFLYICDDAYKRRELPAMEMNVLRGLNFDINIPVPYRFLRRYAKVRALKRHNH
ncbi:G2/mitotic-specific cyclin-B3-like [Myxocyprinus asiaticus]|uniref:G2/mitotic-specific cyclin-B3-like n=1 Tax=Myxocyprinus asiaticus TaxID=70543 RepID=UPI0022229220|nr:G2/mitotic-specific cyclin-B3-like [Myxocyprinus asiaticus]